MTEAITNVSMICAILFLGAVLWLSVFLFVAALLASKD